MDNKNLPMVSIVMLNYNGLKYIKETMIPLLELTYPNFELIIVDNGSTDGSLDFLKKFKDIKLIKNNSNFGFSAGKNIGIMAARGDYILSIDEDILIKDLDIIQKLISQYNTSVGFLQVPLVDRGRDDTYYYGTYYSVYGLNMHRPLVNVKKILHSGNIEICGPTGGFFFVSRKHIAKIGLFDESQPFHLDDVDIGPRSCIFGFKNYLFTQIYCEHLGVNNVSSLENYVSRYKFVFSGHARAMLKNFNRRNLILRFPILLLFHLFKTIKYSFKNKSIKVFNAFLFSNIFFIKHLSDTLDQRRIIQSNRIIKDDTFIKITLPKFNSAK